MQGGSRWSICLPLGIAGLVCGILCSQMRTARPKTEAAGYLSDEGLVLHRQVDLYTHTTRSQVYNSPRPRQILLPRSIRTDLAGRTAESFKLAEKHKTPGAENSAPGFLLLAYG